MFSPRLKLFFLKDQFNDFHLKMTNKPDTVVHNFSPSTQEPEADISVSSRSARPIQAAAGQQELHSGTLYSEKPQT